MENKLTWVAIKKIVAQQTGLSEKEVNTILTGWIDEMARALQQGKDVHVNGLGTFKMKTMKPRKSVNVTTGETIILPETQRLTYTMASSMDEIINETETPHLEVGINPIQKLSDQADEIVDILGELGQGPKHTSADESDENNMPDETETKPIEPQQPERPVIPDYVIPVKKEDTPKEEPKTVDTSKDENNHEKKHLWMTAGITMLVFLLLIVGLVFFFQHKIEQWLNDLQERAEMVDELPAGWTNSDSATPTDSIAVMDTTLTDSTDVATAVQEEPIEEVEYIEFIGEEEMHQDSRLAWMAYRYYGKKDLWVFIYDANKEHISNPNSIPVGTKIKIPKLDQATIALATPEIQEKVKRMADEFLNK
ncbi:MAG: HU family DNA-binding protein [Paludibacteraceae bacterium]|nr:HU family DNA-binding protein [Paludibacteraceae bacterium]